MKYQYGLTFVILCLCTVTDLLQRLVWKRVWIIYGLLVLLGHGAAGMNTIGTILSGMIPGIICLIISRISREALGYGDSMLILMAGMSLGIMECISLLIWAFLFSGLWALFLLAGRKADRKKEIPFVPFLLLGFGVMVLA